MKRGRGGGQRKPYFADSMFVETDFMGRHKRVGSNLDAALKEDAEDTASENEGTNSHLQTETFINIENRQCITPVPKAGNRFVYKVAEPMIHSLTVDTRQQTNTAHITGHLAIMSLPSLKSPVYNATSAFKVTFPWQLFAG